MSVSLSSVESIRNGVQFDSNGFSFSQTAGGCVNNRDFSRGFVDYLQHRASREAYVWECLSAVGDQIGETLYTNVQNYVDFVSNVDMCKVKSLRSMMKMLGFDYTIFDDFDLVPTEVIDLLNVVSIDRKYLLDNKTLKAAFLADLSSEGAIYRYTVPRPQELSSVFDLAQLSSKQFQALNPPAGPAGEYMIADTCLDDSQYWNYVYGLFKTLLMGFCQLEYEVPDKKSEDDRFYIYKSLGLESTLDGDFTEYKKLHNIPLSFDAAGVVDDIDAGADSLDNYIYPYSELLQLEIDRRAAKVTRAQLQAVNSDFEDKYAKAGYVTSNASRYTYYRRAKVKEYVNFIDNKYFINNITSLSVDFYDLNPGYMEISLNRGETEGCTVIGTGATGETQINENVVESVAKSLAVAAMYIVKLRNSLKFQTRKNYMKGTQNLLLYIINEYLIDYATHQLELSKNDDSMTDDAKGYLEMVCKKLQLSSTIGNLDVIEYYDETEYYNLGTETTVSAENNGSDYVHSKFWKQNDLTQDDGIGYALSEIQDFYMNTLALRSGLSSDSQLSDFLDTVFDLGADTSFVDKTTGLFTTKISAHDKYTNFVFAELDKLSSANEEFNAYVGTEYKYPLDTARNQLSDVLNSHIYKDLSAKYLADVSSVYNSYEPQLADLCARYIELSGRYGGQLSGDNELYFISSSNRYCLDGGQYKHDFYIGNPEYEADKFLDKLNGFKRYVEADGNVVNHPFIDVVSDVSATLMSLSSSFKSDVADGLEKYGYMYIAEPLLNQEMTRAYDFITAKQNQRYEYLNNTVDALRQQATGLKATLDNIKANFAACVAGYDDGDPKMKLGDIGTWYIVSENTASHMGSEEECHSMFSGHCRTNKTLPTKALSWYEWANDLGKYAFKYEDDEENDGNYLYQTCHILQYSESDPFETRLEAFTQYVSLKTSMTIAKVVDGDIKKYSVTAYKYSHMIEGVVASINSIKQDYTDLKNSVHSVVAQVNAIGGNFDESAYSTVDETIDALITYLNNFDPLTFEGDPTLTQYRQYMQRLLEISACYVPILRDYNDLFKDSYQRQYFQPFTYSKEFTYADMARLATYVADRDRDSKLKLIANEKSMRDVLDAYTLEYTNLTAALLIDAPDFVNSGAPYLETQMSGVYQFLIEDIDRKTRAANLLVDVEKERVDGYAAVISAEISADLSSTENFAELVNRRIDFLNFFEDDQYKYRNGLFLTYAGRDYCYYPHYNASNMTHPSYQVHPYLWNFVAKDDNLVSLLKKSFYSVYVTELMGENLKHNIDTYYGEFGQSINKWLNPNMIDYSGYTTRYESSSHATSRSQISSEVVDYDGGFYPPAVDMMNQASATSMASLLSAVDSGFIRTGVEAVLSGSISSYVAIERHVDEATGERSYSFLSDVAVEQNISGLIVPYLPSADISGIVDSYFRSRLVSADLTAVDTQSFASELTSSLPKSFYQLYYKHLNIARNDAERRYIVDQLSTYYPEARSTILADHDIKSVYDIYQYGLDSNSNIYVLYKQYGIEEPTYKERRDTPGELWIRLKDHPIAFPAFYGRYPNVYLREYSRISQAIKDLASLSGEAAYARDLSSITDRMRFFYDFEFTEDGKYLYLVSQLRDQTIRDVSASFQTYENPWIINCKAQKFDDANLDLIDFFVDGEDATSKHTNRIRSGADYQLNPALSVDPVEVSGDIRNYAYIGSYLQSTNVANFVYVQKDYLSSGTVVLRDHAPVKIFQFNSGLYKADSQYTVTGSDIVSGETFNSDICFSYNNGQMTFAYLTKRKSGSMKSATGGSVDVVSVDDGFVYGDPRAVEMNSFDTFDADVAVVKADVKNSKLERVADDGVWHNMNADMSYVPSYPGLSGESSYYSSALAGRSHYAVQLLGDSKNIDEQIRRVNVDVDPYFDMGRISDDYMFGRVYEDFIDHMDLIDKSFYAVQNPSINNMLPPNNAGISQVLKWNVSLDAKKYTQQEIGNLKILFYNRETLGKNPYMICGVRDISGVWTDVQNYNPELSAGETAETAISSSQFNYNAYANVTGTQDRDGKMNASDCNHIKNVSGIVMKYSPELNQIQVQFKVADEAKIDTTHVSEGQLQMLIYSTTNLTIFEYYHYFDAYGAVNIYNGKPDIPHDHIGDGWKFAYDQSKYDDTQVLCALYGYYERNGKKEFLRDINLSAYSYLSNVYILQGDKRLSFKYDESSVFDFSDSNYYFPTLNHKYPKLPSEYIEDNGAFSKDYIKSSQLARVFGENNLFILDLTDPAPVEDAVYRVDVPITMDEVDCFRGYEQFDVDDGGNVVRVFDPGDYDVADVRSMQGVQFCEMFTESPHEDWSAAEVSARVLAAMNNPAYAQTSAFLDKIWTDYGIAPQGSEQTVSQTASDTVSFDVDKIDLSGIMKLYVNYKKSSDGITLYFNYFNYLNTPYVRIENNKVYPEIIDGTYAKVGQDQTGYIDLVAQVKYYVAGKLYGTRNLTLVTYQVTNISDDKPKFVIRQSNVLTADKLKRAEQPANVSLTLANATVDLNQYDDMTAKPEVYIKVSMQTDAELRVPYTFGVEYPGDMMQPVEGQKYSGYTVNSAERGYLEFRTSTPYASVFSVKMKFTKTVYELQDMVNSYLMYLDETDILFGANGLEASVEYNNGSLKITKNSQKLLSFGYDAAQISAYAAQNHQSEFYIDGNL